MNDQIHLAKDLLGEDFSHLLNALKDVLLRLSLAKTAKLLDIGTGRGHMAIGLALFGYKVITGEPKGANWANWTDPAHKLNLEQNISFQALNAEQLQFPDNEFDAVFLYSTLHHIDNKSIALKEALRILKQGGNLVVIELTQKGVESVRKRRGSHPDAVDPRMYTKNWNFPIDIIRGDRIDSYIYYINEKT